MKFKIWILLIGLCLWGTSEAQTLRAYETAAASAFEDKDYFAAMKYYEQAMRIDPSSGEIHYRYAEACRMFGALFLAEEHYTILLNQGKSNGFPQTKFWLAQVKKSLGNYDEAIVLFQDCLTQTDLDQAMRQTASQELAICEWALEDTNHPDVTIIIERLSDRINTGLSEYAPLQQGDKTYYTAFRQEEWGDKHFPARPILKIMEIGKSGVATENPVFNDPKRHSAHLCFSPDGKMAVLNRCDYTGETEIRSELYYSTKGADGQWSAPQLLPEPLNLPDFTATEPTLAQGPHGSYSLYFASNRPGGKGGLDLWLASLESNGAIGSVENLQALNTPADEITPYFFEPESALYFSSEGYPSLGGFDVYKSNLVQDVWQKPVHMPMPINSSFNDLYYAPQAGNWAYFASNRIGSANIDGDACCFDLYKSTILPINLEATVYSELTGEALNNVVFSLEEKESPIRTRFVNNDNQSSWEIKRDRSYTLVAHREGYLSDTVQVQTNLLPNDRRFAKKMYLKPDIGLSVRTFNQLSEEPLYGVAIRLIEISGKRESITVNNAELSGSMHLDAHKQYMLIAEKEGYYPDTLMLAETDLKNAVPGNNIGKNIFLTPASLSGYLPLTLYFDNDQPKGGRSIQPYDQAYLEYMAQKEAFINGFTENLSEEEKSKAVDRLGTFFEEEVKGGYMKLEYFAENLDLFLNNNYSVEVLVKGFASPLANADYNLALTRRRIASVRTYFRKYNNGTYMPYLQSGQLTISTAPLGESEAASGVVDSQKDRRNSVYSVEASRERRTEIIEVKLTKN